MKIERGVMVVNADGKAWGTLYEDGNSWDWGWVDIENGGLHDARYCRTPTDVTYQGSPYTYRLSKAKLVRVERRTEVVVLDG